MTFSAQETSAESGAPIELYEFRYGPLRLYYANTPEDVTYNSRVWTATPLDRTEIEETLEIARQSVTISVAPDSQVAGLFRFVPPAEPVEVIIHVVHRTDPLEEVKTRWFGRVLNCRWEGPMAQLSCESILTSFRRLGLRRHYQRTCPHVLYGVACGALPGLHVVEDTLSAVNGTSIVIPVASLQANGYYAGGILEWVRGPGQFERRTIRSHVTDTLVLTYRIPGLTAGMTVSLLPGCNHLMTDCDGKFSNSDNYGGWPIPQRNPFGQNGAF